MKWDVFEAGMCKNEKFVRNFDLKTSGKEHPID
jgi:hypothetical protein